MTTKQKIEKVLSEIILCYPAFSYIIFNWDLEETTIYDTMATNYKKLLYNPQYVDSLSMENLIAVILHEILHCVFLHPTEISRIQSEGKDFQCWIMALEIVTNAAVRDLINGKKYELPGNSFSPLKDKSPIPPIYYYDPIGHNHTALEIYEKLLQEKPNISCPWPMIVFSNDGNGGGNGNAQGGKQEGGNENTGEDKSQTNGGTITIDILPAEKGEFPDAVERAIATLEKLQKQIGYLPGGLSRQIDKLTKGKVPWRRILHFFVAIIKAGMEDYSWNRPDFKRSSDIIYPASVEYDIDNIVVVIDTSGSISQKELQRFASEVASLTHYTDEILLITTDAEVHEKIKVRNAKDIINKVKFTGGGGTDFRPIFEQIKKCEAMVFFTDGYATYPNLAPSYPVLWILTGNNKMPPFGKVAYMLDE